MRPTFAKVGHKVSCVTKCCSVCTGFIWRLIVATHYHFNIRLRGFSTSVGQQMSLSAEGVYREQHVWLESWLTRKLSCRHQAADIAHDTFVRLLQLGGQLSALQEPRAWLTTTARHLLIDLRRRQTLEQAWLAELAHDDNSNQLTPERQLAALQMLEGLLQLLEGVPAKAAEAFVRHYLDGEPQAAIAASLGVSERMVRKYLVQVLMHCQQWQAAHG